MRDIGYIGRIFISSIPLVKVELISDKQLLLDLAGIMNNHWLANRYKHSIYLSIMHLQESRPSSFPFAAHHWCDFPTSFNCGALSLASWRGGWSDLFSTTHRWLPSSPHLWSLPPGIRGRSRALRRPRGGRRCTYLPPLFNRSIPVSRSLLSAHNDDSYASRLYHPDPPFPPPANPSPRQPPPRARSFRHQTPGPAPSRRRWRRRGCILRDL